MRTQRRHTEVELTGVHMHDGVIVGTICGANKKLLALVAARVDMGSQTVMMLVATQNTRVRYPKALVQMIQFKHELHDADKEHKERLNAVRARVKEEQQQAVVFPWAGGTYRVQLAPRDNCPPLHVQQFENTWDLWRPEHYIRIRLHRNMRLTTGFALGKLQKISLRHGGEGAAQNDDVVDELQESDIGKGNTDSERMQFLLDTLKPLHENGIVENHWPDSDETLAWMHHVFELRRWYYIDQLRAAKAKNRQLSKRDLDLLEKTRDAVRPPRDIFDSDAQSRAHLQRLLEALRSRPAKRTAAAREEGDKQPLVAARNAREEGDKQPAQDATAFTLAPRTHAQIAADWRAKAQDPGVSETDKRQFLDMAAFWEWRAQAQKKREQEPRPLKRSNATAFAVPPQQENGAGPAAP